MESAAASVNTQGGKKRETYFRPRQPLEWHSTDVSSHFRLSDGHGTAAATADITFEIKGHAKEANPKRPYISTGSISIVPKTIIREGRTQVTAQNRGWYREGETLR